MHAARQVSGTGLAKLQTGTAKRIAWVSILSAFHAHTMHYSKAICIGHPQIHKGNERQNSVNLYLQKPWCRAAMHTVRRETACSALPYGPFCNMKRAKPNLKTASIATR